MKSVPPAVAGGYSLTIGPHKTPHICSQSGAEKALTRPLKGRVTSLLDSIDPPATAGGTDLIAHGALNNQELVWSTLSVILPVLASVRHPAWSQRTANRII